MIRRAIVLLLLVPAGCAVVAPPPPPTSAAPSRPASRTLVASRLIEDPSGHGSVELSLTSPVRRGQLATASAVAAPGSRCEIAVAYATGTSEAKGLAPRATDEAGGVSWSWMVGLRTTIGSWPVLVRCAAPDGKVGRARAALSVID